MIELTTVVHVKGQGYFYVEDDLSLVLEQIRDCEESFLPMLHCHIIGPKDTVAVALSVPLSEIAMIVAIPKSIAFPHLGA